MAGDPSEAHEALRAYNATRRRAWVLRRKGWPWKDLAAKLREEGYGKHSVYAIKRMVQDAERPLTHQELRALIDTASSGYEALQEVLSRMAGSAFEQEAGSSGNALHLVSMVIKDWLVANASSLGDGESLRRLRPGLPSFVLAPTEAEIGKVLDDPDSHSAWQQRKSAAPDVSAKPN